MQRSERIKLGIVGGLVLLGLCVWLPILSGQAGDEYFAVHFLDVGQGDAVLVQTPDGYEALIDGGTHRGVLRAIATQQQWFDRSIDVVVATHADQDHVGGLVDVLQHYDVPLILLTEATGQSPGAAAFSTAVAAENASVMYARAGQVVQLGASTTIEVLAPASPTDNWKPNVASIILRITYGDTAIMLTGDAPASIEDYLVGTYGAHLQADILKLGHHGSKTSTSETFLATVDPDYAVVSAGHDNQYGHPHQSVLDRVTTQGSTIYQTGIDGTITFYSDGQRVWVE